MNFSNNKISFFSVFQEKFSKCVKDTKNTNSNYIGGRYLAFILEEVLKNCPELINKIIKKANFKDFKLETKNLEINLEYPYKGKNKNRRIDIELKDDNNTLDIELKWDDKFHDNQYEDYINRLKKEVTNHAFIILTKNECLHQNDEKDINIKEALQNITHAYHMKLIDLYKIVEDYLNVICSKTNKISQNAIKIGMLKLLLEFLEDYIMKYETNINGIALVKFMEASCGWKHDDGFKATKQKNLLEELPKLLYTLMNNINLIAIENVYKDFKEHFKTKGFDDFKCLSQLPNNIKENTKLIGCSSVCKDAKYSAGGEFIVYHRFSKGPSSSQTGKYLEFGIKFKFDYSKKGTLTRCYYVKFNKDVLESTSKSIKASGKGLFNIELENQEKLYNKYLKQAIEEILLGKI